MSKTRRYCHNWTTNLLILQTIYMSKVIKINGRKIHTRPGNFLDAIVRNSFSQLKGSAVQRGLNMQLTIDQFKDIKEKNCSYCGQSPERDSAAVFRKRIAKHRIKRGKRGHAPLQNAIKNVIWLTNGIDRIDSAKGYTLKNSTPCCLQCNQAKLDWSVKEFESWLKRAYQHRFKSQL